MDGHLRSREPFLFQLPNIENLKNNRILMKNRLNLLDLLIPAVETKVDPCLHPPGKNQMQRAALENMFHICPHKKKW